MTKYDSFEEYLFCTFGEGTAEDIVEAICFYLMNCTYFPSKSTSFELLKILSECPSLMCSVIDKYNPLLNFELTFRRDNDENIN